MSYAQLVTKNGDLYVRCGEGEEAELKEVKKGWESFGGMYWFGIEYEDDTGRWFGLVQGQYDELGYWTEDQLEPLIQQGKVWEINPEDLAHSGRR